MADPNHTAVLGAGVIGASWTALFLAAGHSVAVYDPADDVEKTVRTYVENAWPTLTDLGMTNRGDPEALTFHQTPSQAIEHAMFVQESVPERLPIKHELYAEIEEALDPGAVIASSASGLTLSEMQVGWRDPSNFVLGHPFNPPHLIPLVEVMSNDRTGSGMVETAERFLRRCRQGHDSGEQGSPRPCRQPPAGGHLARGRPPDQGGGRVSRRRRQGRIRRPWPSLGSHGTDDAVSPCSW